ncbi:hypothetical protein [Lysobacter capsici]|nr:hypothetical protein [Lysobacter capsici]QWF16486.1 hypothetical protein KME82_22480 [Lysobacter capsici]
MSDDRIAVIGDALAGLRSSECKIGETASTDRVYQTAPDVLTPARR